MSPGESRTAAAFGAWIRNAIWWSGKTSGEINCGACGLRPREALVDCPMAEKVTASASSVTAVKRKWKCREYMVLPDFDADLTVMYSEPGMKLGLRPLHVPVIREGLRSRNNDE